MNDEKIENYFTYNNILPIVVFLVGVLAIYFFVSNMYAEGFLSMVFSFIVYMIHNFIVQRNRSEEISAFDKYLEELVMFIAFGVAPIVFGASFYSSDQNFFILLVIYFFAITTMLCAGRNWILGKKYTQGWPLPFNGLFLPLIYYIYQFYLQSPGSSIFLFYFGLVGFFSMSNFNFLGFEVAPKKEEEEEEQVSVDSMYSMNSELKEFVNNYEQKENEPVFEEEYFDDISEEPVIEDEPLNETTMPNEKDKIKLVEVESEPEEKESLFKKVIGFIIRKDKFNLIRGMPSKKEVEETLIEEEEVSPKAIEESEDEKMETEESHIYDEEIIDDRNIDEISEDDMIVVEEHEVEEERKEEIKKPSKLIRFAKSIFSIFKRKDKFNVIEDMPDKTELEETLVDEEEIKSEKEELKVVKDNANSEFIEEQDQIDFENTEEKTN